MQSVVERKVVMLLMTALYMNTYVNYDIILLSSS
jgi:hypothetical protein